MIRRITLENYMSHARTVIEPADGLTVICGPNNCGKSAVVSAIETLCGGPRGDFMVRHGTKESRIIIETSEGDTITWERKKAVVCYRINDRADHRNVPEDLHAFLKLPLVRHPDNPAEKFDVHLGSQKKPIFLIDDESGTAAFFSAQSESSRLVAMQRRHKQKTAEAKSRRDAIVKDIEKATTHLAALEPVDAIQEQLAQVTAEHKHLTERVRKQQQLSNLVIELERRQRVVHRAIERRDVLHRIAPPPVLQDDARLARMTTRLDQVRRTWAVNRSRIDALTPVKAPPTLVDTTPLVDMGRRLRKALDAKLALQASVEALAPLQSPPASKDLAPLAKLIDALAIQQRGTGRLRQQVKALTGLRSPAAPADVSKLDAQLQKLANHQAKIAAVRQTVTSLSKQLSAVSKSIDIWVSENAICPVCKAPTDKSRLIAGVHAHE